MPHQPAPHVAAAANLQPRRAAVAAFIGTTIPVDPGAHTLEAQRDGISVDRQEVTLEEGESRTITLATQAGGVVDPELLHPVATDEDEGGDDIWLWTAIGAGAGVVVLGIVIGVTASAAGGPQPYRGNLEPGFLEIRP